MKIIKQDFDFELKKYKELELYKINSMLENQKQRISNDLDLFSL